jgi:hypothetical protein
MAPAEADHTCRSADEKSGGVAMVIVQVQESFGQQRAASFRSGLMRSSIDHAMPIKAIRQYRVPDAGRAANPLAIACDETGAASK